MAVATSVSFVAIAVARSWAIGSRIVVAAKLKLLVEQGLASGLMAKTSIVLGITVSAIIWLLAGSSVSSQTCVQVMLLTFAIIFADMPRQALIFAGKHKSSVILSLTYAVGGLSALCIAYTVHWSPILLWTVTSAICGILGWLRQPSESRGPSNLPARIARSHAWGLTAETLYGAVASQLGLFLLFCFTDHNATTGYRLSYAIVFAPAFMLIQGVTPLLTVHMAKQISKSGVISASTWFAGPVIATTSALACGLIGWFAAEMLPVPTNFKSVTAFLFPVGFAMLASQVLEFFLAGLRYTTTQQFMHRLRVILVTGDVLLQGLGVWLDGIDGLIYALIASGAAKLLGGLALGLRRGLWTSKKGKKLPRDNYSH